MFIYQVLRKKCLIRSFSYSDFSRIWTEIMRFTCNYPCSVRIRKNAILKRILNRTLITKSKNSILMWFSNFIP